MKIQTITEHGPAFIKPIGETAFIITNHTRPTQVAECERQLEEAIRTFDDGEAEIRLIATHDQAEIVLTQDERHGTNGWRGSRYLHGQWDEWYLFFPHLRDAIKALAQFGEDAEAEIKKARRAF